MLIVETDMEPDKNLCGTDIWGNKKSLIKKTIPRSKWIILHKN